MPPTAEGLTPDGLTTLIGTIDALSTEVAGMRSEISTENDLRDIETKHTRLFAKVASVIGLIGIVIGNYGIYAASNAQATANDVQAVQKGIIATRAESRKTTCDEANKFITNHNILVSNVEKAAALVNQPDPLRSPEVQAGIDKFVAEYVASIETSRVELRDCSPDGIAAFYHDNG